MDENKDNLRPVPFTNQEKTQMMEAQLLHGIDREIAPEHLRYFPDSNLRVYKDGEADSADYHLVQRTYLSFDRTKRVAQVQAEITVHPSPENPGNIGKVEIDKFVDMSNPDPMAISQADIELEENTLSFQREPFVAPKPDSRIDPIITVEGESTRLERRLTYNYRRSQLDQASFSVRSVGPETPSQKSQTLPGLSWARDDQNEMMLSLTGPMFFLESIPLLDQGPVREQTEIGLCEFSFKDKTLIVKRLTDQEKLIDEIKLPMEIPDANQILEQILDEPKFADDPAAHDASYDQGWLHAHLLKAVGVDWQPHKA